MHCHQNSNPGKRIDLRLNGFLYFSDSLIKRVWRSVEWRSPNAINISDHKFIPEGEALNDKTVVHHLPPSSTENS